MFFKLRNERLLSLAIFYISGDSNLAPSNCKPLKAKSSSSDTINIKISLISISGIMSVSSRDPNKF